MSEWHVYLLRSADGSLYTGITTDVERRLEAHRNGRGAKALRGRGPLEIENFASAGDRARASRVERKIKALKKKDKEALARSTAELRRFVEAAGAKDEP